MGDEKTTERAPDLTLEEVAEELQVHRNTVSQWLREGRMPGAYYLGNRWRVPRASLDEFKRGCARCNPTG